MTKTIRKLMAVLLSLCMMLSLLSVSAFAATKDDVLQYKSYTSLGDSAAAGNGLKDWDAMKLRWGNSDWDAGLDKAVKEEIAQYNQYAPMFGKPVVAEGTPEYETLFEQKKAEKLATMTEDELNELKYVDYTRRHEVYGSYASILAKAVGAYTFLPEDNKPETEGTFHHYAQVAFRTEELRMVLDKNYKGDSEDLIAITAASSKGSFDYQNLLELQENGEYVNAIKNSNLVTMSIGSNDIYLPILGTVLADVIALQLKAATEAQSNQTEEEVVEEVKEAVATGDTAAIEENIENMDTAEITSQERTEEEVQQGEAAVAEASETDGEASVVSSLAGLLTMLAADDPSYIGKILKLVVQCELNYRINYTAIVNKIFEINPNVTLVVPLYTMDYDSIGDLGKIMKIAFAEMNLFVKARSHRNGHFITVKLPEDQLTFVDMAHPDEAGHALIAEALLNALPTAASVKGTTVKQGADNNWYAYTNGNYDETVNSVVKNALGWWKVENGKVNFGFNGIATNENGTWYLLGGKVQFLKTGYVRVDKNGNQVLTGGTRYKVVGGKVLNYKS